LTGQSRAAKWRASHLDYAREQSREYMRAQRLANPEEVNRRQQEWRNKNREHAKQYGREWYAKNRERATETQRLSNYRSWGLDVAEAKRVFDSRNRCEICGVQVSGKNKHLDHDHVTLKVRGVLCSRCNTSLPAIENMLLLQKTMAYLRRAGSILEGDYP
jgi:hypothetical protein